MTTVTLYPDYNTPSEEELESNAQMEQYKKKRNQQAIEELVRRMTEQKNSRK